MKEINPNMIVSASPHLRGKSSTRRIMLDVLIALLPCAAAGIYYFGAFAAINLVLAVASAVLTEFICRKILKRTDTIGDFSAVVSGLILGLIMPPSINPLITAFGSMVAIAFVKQLFGGIGQNFVNPAATARIVLLISFPAEMSKWTFGWDAVTSATPLITKTNGYWDLFIGNTSGSIGETCKIAIIIGFIYLLARRVIEPVIPLTCTASAAVITWFLGGDVLFQLLSGGLLFGAVFMATDYATCPISRWGKLIYGTGCGVLTILIRFYASAPEGVTFAIVFMDIIVPHLDYIFIPKPFGQERRRKS